MNLALNLGSGFAIDNNLMPANSDLSLLGLNLFRNLSVDKRLNAAEHGLRQTIQGLNRCVVLFSHFVVSVCHSFKG